MPEFDRVDPPLGIDAAAAALRFLADRHGCDVLPPESVSSRRASTDGLAIALIDSLGPQTRKRARSRLLDRAGRARVVVATEPPGTPLSIVEDTLADAGLPIAFSGFTTNGRGDTRRQRPVVIVDETGVGPGPAPAKFTATAFVPVFNEVDLLRSTLSDLIEQGVRVHVLDNWSTDGSYEVAQDLLGTGSHRVDRVPGSPMTVFSSGFIDEAVAERLPLTRSDWFLRVDADELRRSPWPSTRLIDSFAAASARGFNAGDNTVIDFVPVDEGFPDGGSPGAYFHHGNFGERPGHFVQIKYWSDHEASIAGGGHDTTFEGRRVLPYKFLLRHYPIRSTEHGRRKILHERQPRFDPSERAKGWHIQYDHIDEEHRFLSDPEQLIDVRDDFDRRYLLERLTGIGIPRLVAPIPGT